MKRAIVIDTSRMGRDLAAGLIARLRPNWTVHAVAGVVAALVAARSGPPDIVLVDMTDPASRGLDTARELRRRFPRALVALACSGFEAPTPGADEDGFARVAKPFTSHGVRHLVELLPADGARSDFPSPAPSGNGFQDGA